MQTEVLDLRSLLANFVVVPLVGVAADHNPGVFAGSVGAAGASARY